MVKERIIERAREVGIDVIGFTTADPFDADIERMDALREEYYRTGAGHRGFANSDLRLRLFPRDFYRDARTVIVAAQPIPPGNTVDKSTPDRPRGVQATNYARKGNNWYGVLEEKMDQVAEFIRGEGHTVVEPYGPAVFRAMRVRPRYNILLRAAAIRAGISQRGKNTMAYSKEYGTFQVLSALYTDLEVEPDAPSNPESGCGDCRACQKACPYQALETPYVLDVQRCVAGSINDDLHTNMSQPIPEDKRRAVGMMSGGCEVCQLVCPKNRDLSQDQHDLAEQLDPDSLHPDLIERLERSKGVNPLWSLNLGNSKSPAAVGALAKCVGEQESPWAALTRAYSAWALGEIGNAAAAEALRGALEEEEDEMVRKEISAALKKC